jgi:hypothetical protein
MQRRIVAGKHRSQSCKGWRSSEILVFCFGAMCGAVATFSGEKLLENSSQFLTISDM